MCLLGYVGMLQAASFTTNGWTTWSPREEIAPRFHIEAKGGRSQDPALKIETDAASDFGAWRKQFEGIASGKTYRLSLWYRAEGLRNERRSVIARIQWLNAQGKDVRPPDYALDVEEQGHWKRIELVTPAPTNATGADVQLGLGFAARGTVWFDQVELVPEREPKDRVVRALTIHHRPRGMKSAPEALEQFCALAEGALPQKPDIICLPEGVTVVGTGKSYVQVSEPVPGPSTERLGRLAKSLHSYVVAGLYERSGKRVYNTAVLLDREGKPVGKYRKTHLPREEWEAGITPGDTYPVFQTDFGKVGIMICWDLQFPEPCRALAAQGAVVVLLPIWGGSEILAQARAIENHVFLVSSSYDMRSFILDPTGKILAEATPQQPVAGAELYLDRKLFQPWLGDMSTRTWKERRTDIAVP